MGKKRFRDFIASDEKIPSNVLSERLARLEHHRVIERIPAADSDKWHAYALTQKGLDLLRLVKDTAQWGDRHLENTKITEDLQRVLDMPESRR